MFTIYMPAEPSKKAVAACPRVHNKIMKKSYKYFTNNSAIYMLCFLLREFTKKDERIKPK